jgi:hypothetical protein
VNCKGEHAAFDKSCPRWQIETAIMKAKTDGNISFQEARKIVEEKSALPTTGITYSAMASRSTKSISTQTEIVNCTCHCRVDIMHAQPGTVSASIQTDNVAPCLVADFAKVAASTISQASTTALNTKQRNNNQPSISNTSNINTSTQNTVNKAQVTPKGATSRIPTSGGNSQGEKKKGVRDSGGVAVSSCRDTCGGPDRVPKGSGDPIRLYNRYGSLDHMDTIDGAAISSTGRKGSVIKPEI